LRVTIVFYISAAVALACTAMVITRANAVHALLYLVVSLFALAIDFYVLGAPFVAALEVIIYAGAIIVLFVFVVMLLSFGPAEIERERTWLRAGAWIGPALLAAVLLAELVFIIVAGGAAPASGAVDPKQVGEALFGPYLLGVELASFLLLAGLVGAYHLGRREPAGPREGGDR
jgi:NADH-quinone oxidoreductase subunit J